MISNDFTPADFDTDDPEAARAGRHLMARARAAFPDASEDRLSEIAATLSPARDLDDDDDLEAFLPEPTEVERQVEGDVRASGADRIKQVTGLDGEELDDFLGSTWGGRAITSEEDLRRHVEEWRRSRNVEAEGVSRVMLVGGFREVKS